MRHILITLAVMLSSSVAASADSGPPVPNATFAAPGAAAVAGPLRMNAGTGWIPILKLESGSEADAAGPQRDGNFRNTSATRRSLLVTLVDSPQAEALVHGSALDKSITTLVIQDGVKTFTLTKPLLTHVRRGALTTSADRAATEQFTFAYRSLEVTQTP